MKKRVKTNPPGRQKIIEALSELMEKKEFHSITTAEIAETAGVTEGLIYKYFAAKRDLLYEVLHLHFSAFNQEVDKRLAEQDSAVGKLETLIHASLESYSSNRVFARILLLEVRNLPSYFDSDAYRMVRAYAGTLLGIIEDGVDSGELKKDINPHMVQKVIMGAIEHGLPWRDHF